MAYGSQFSLLLSRRFAPYFATQCLGALNDNILRQGIVMLITFALLPNVTTDPAVLANLIAGLFILPFLLASAYAGQLADKYDKAFMIRRFKLLEIALMALAVVALWLESLPALLALVFAMGLQSTLFGPIKYAILPQLVRRDALMGANGLVEGGTYLAIIAGLFIGGFVVSFGDHSLPVLAGTLLVVAVLGYLSSLAIPSLPPADPELSIRVSAIRESIRACRLAYRDRSVFLSIMGLSWFWAFGLVALAQLPALGRAVLNGNEMVVNALLVCFALGIGVGALVCERLSRKHIELGLVPLGAIGMSVFAFDVFSAYAGHAPGALVTAAALLRDPQHWRLLIDLTLIGVSGGLFSVPLYAMMQDRSPPAQRARIVAANNILNSVFMIAMALFSAILLLAGLDIPALFAVLAIMNFVIAAYLFWLLPEFVMRLVTWLLVNVMYRCRVEHAERMPAEGACLIVANHVSFVDALLIGGLIRRPVRFVMYYKIFQIPVLSFLFRTAKAIPIAGRREDPELMAEAFELIDAELAAGRPVCIFPEGAITRDGKLATFRPGMERILARRPVPVVPMALSNLWGSWFSRAGGGAVRKWPRRFRARITLSVGTPVAAADASAERMQRAVQALLDGRGEVGLDEAD